MIINIKQIDVNEKDKARILPILDRNWIGIHRATVKTPHTEAGMTELLKFVKLEISEGKKRDYVLHRLYRKACGIRRELEEKQLYV